MSPPHFPALVLTQITSLGQAIEPSAMKCRGPRLVIEHHMLSNPMFAVLLSEQVVFSRQCVKIGLARLLKAMFLAIMHLHITDAEGDKSSSQALNIILDVYNDVDEDRRDKWPDCDSLTDLDSKNPSLEFHDPLRKDSNEENATSAYDGTKEEEGIYFGSRKFRGVENMEKALQVHEYTTLWGRQLKCANTRLWTDFPTQVDNKMQKRWKEQAEAITDKEIYSLPAVKKGKCFTNCISAFIRKNNMKLIYMPV